MNATVTFPTVVWTFTTAALLIWILIRPREVAPWKILAMIAVFALEPFSSAIMNAENRQIPLKYDHFLQAIDQALGITAFWIARLLALWQKTVLFGIYESLTFAMIAWYTLHLKVRNGRPRQLLYAYLLAFCLGPCLYLVVPACGPRHAFPLAFPWGQPNIDLTLVSLNYWPNAIPSLHVTTALLLLLFTARNMAMRMIAWIYLAGTVLGTLAFEHYLIDLIVAVPFACFAASAAQRRFGTATAYLIVVLGWMLVIRLDTPLLLAHPYFLRAGVLLTVWMGIQYGADREPKRITESAVASRGRTFGEEPAEDVTLEALG
jgi:hypothetical protein